MTSKSSKYVVCIRNKYFDKLLKVLKVYRTIKDNQLKKGLIRIIDDSEKDHVYPIEYFVPIKIPKKIAEKLFKTGA